MGQAHKRPGRDGRQRGHIRVTAGIPGNGAAVPLPKGPHRRLEFPLAGVARRDHLRRGGLQVAEERSVVQELSGRNIAAPIAEKAVSVRPVVLPIPNLHEEGAIVTILEGAPTQAEGRGQPRDPPEADHVTLGISRHLHCEDGPASGGRVVSHQQRAGVALLRAQEAVERTIRKCPYGNASGKGPRLTTL